MKQLLLLVGISGSGKSYFINKNGFKKYVVCPDDIRRELTGNVSDHSKEDEVWTTVYKRLGDNLNHYGKAVLDATNLISKYRVQLLDKFPNTKTVAVVFPANPALSKQRIHQDLANGKDRSNVPDDVIDIQYSKFINNYNALWDDFDLVVDPNLKPLELQFESVLKKIVKEEIRKVLDINC